VAAWEGQGSLLVASRGRRERHTSVCVHYRSSMESEYKALGNATSELIWVQALLSELGISHKNPPIL
jgi:hypothetical protein